MRNNIWLGDLAVAWQTLDLDEDARLSAAALLGLASGQGGVAGQEPGADAAALARFGAGDSRLRPVSPAVRPPDTQSVLDLPLLAPDAYEPAAVSWTVASLDRPTPAGQAAEPAHVPLFSRNSVAAITAELVGRYVDDGPVDVAATVALLSRALAVHSFPRQRRRSLRFGAQILVDRGDSMRPFARDQDDMVRQLQRSAGNVEIWYFRAAPQRAMRMPFGKSQPYRPPSHGTPVLLLTDFGAVSQLNCRPTATRREWSDFLTSLRQHGARPVGLVPYPRSRWPAWLASELPLVSWDRRTTAGAVSAALR